MNKIFHKLIKHIPQLEPLLYVSNFTVLDDEAWEAAGLGSMKTACCSPKGFFFHAEFWGGLPENKQAGLVLHEVLHGALQHLSDPFTDHTISRADFHRLANVAQDIVIEHSIWDVNGGIQPGKDRLERDIVCNYSVELLEGEYAEFKGMSWRTVYDVLRSRAKVGEGEGGEAVCDLSQARGAGTSEAQSQRWQSAAKESDAIKEKLRGQGSAAGGLVLDLTVSEPVVPWQQLLAEYLTSRPAPVNRTWSKIKRRPFGASGAYVASKSGSTLSTPHTNLLLDTSGSMAADYSAMAAEVLSICSMASSVHRIDYDVGIAYEELIKEPSEYVIDKLYGGGGTCIRTTIQQLVERPDFDKSAPTVVLTDSGDNYNVADLGVACVFVTYGAPFKSDAGPCFSIPKP